MTTAEHPLPAQPHPGAARKAEGFATPKQDKKPQCARMLPKRVLPIIFLPGIMGSNLRMSAERQKELKQKDNIAWRPYGLGKSNISKNANNPPDERQLRLDPLQTTVDIYDPSGPSDVSGDGRHGNVELGENFNSPSLMSDTEPHGRTAVQKSRARGWGEVYFKSYGVLLQHLESRLNNTFSEGKMRSEWRDVVGIDPQVWNPDPRLPQQALTEEELKKVATGCWFPVYAFGYNWLQSNGDSAKIIAKRINKVIDELNESGYECNHLIVVTHSMGGLVARALVHPKIGNLQDKVLGIVHGAIALFGFSQTLPAAIVLGLGLALSSTALGLQSLAESKQLNAPHGRLAFAILLFQDIAAIPLIALVPLLAASGPDTSQGDSLQHGLKVFASIAVVIIGGRYLLRPVFRTVARTGLPEVSTATALLVVIGTAWLMEEAGISMALGAFLAGLLLADSEYRHELESQIEPFKGLLLGLFFISVGMGANLRLLLEMPLVVLGLTLLLVAVKLLLLIGVGRWVGGLNSASALRLGMVLAAGGEFAFVVFKLGKDQGLFDTQTYDLLLMTITLSMAITPLLMLGCARALKRPQPAREVPEQYKQIQTDTPRVVIVGMGRMGQIVARILRAQKIPFVALETSVDTIEMTRMFEQVPVFYGDPLRPEVLHAAKVGEAEYFIITIDDPEAAIHTAARVKRLYPHLRVLARARNRQHVHKLADVGAEPIRETFYSSLEMTRRALVGLGLSDEQAADRIARFTQHDEEVLEAQGQVRDDRAKVMQTAKEARVELERLFDSDAD